MLFGSQRATRAPRAGRSGRGAGSFCAEAAPVYVFSCAKSGFGMDHLPYPYSLDVEAFI